MRWRQDLFARRRRRLGLGLRRPSFGRHRRRGHSKHAASHGGCLVRVLLAQALELLLAQLDVALALLSRLADARVEGRDADVVRLVCLVGHDLPAVLLVGRLPRTRLRKLARCTAGGSSATQACRVATSRQGCAPWSWVVRWRGGEWAACGCQCPSAAARKEPGRRGWAASGTSVDELGELGHGLYEIGSRPDRGSTAEAPGPTASACLTSRTP